MLSDGTPAAILRRVPLETYKGFLREIGRA